MPKLSPKILTLIALVLAIISVSLFAMKQKAVAPQQESQVPMTTNWKVYQNDALEFSIEYPDSFKVDDEPTENSRIVSFMEFDEKAKSLSNQAIPGYFPVISIYKWSDINSADLKGGNWEGEKNYKNFQDFLTDGEHTAIKVIGETSIDGVKAFTLSMPGEIGYEARMFEYNGSYYRISFPWAQKKLDENIKKQFLSSIRFIR